MIKKLYSFHPNYQSMENQNAIKYGVTPSEFEMLAGSHARKWKQSIKCDGKHLGE